MKKVFLILIVLAFIPTASLGDSVEVVDVNTSPLSGASAQLGFDFIDGGSPSNTITLSDFSTDGTLGGVFPTGGVSGTLPGTVTLTDSFFFNEYLTNITLGNSFSFILDATTSGPDLGSLPDAFSLFLLNPVTGLPLFATTDPTGSDSLLTLNIDGSTLGTLDVFSAPGGESVVTVTRVSVTPEPGTLLLLGSGLALFSLRRKKVKVRQTAN